MKKKQFPQLRPIALAAMALAAASILSAQAQTTFFADSFDRSDDYDLDAITNGMSGVVVSAGAMGPGNTWLEPIDDALAVPHDSQVIFNQLLMGGNAHAVYTTLNRNFATLMANGTVSVSLDLVTGPSGTTPLHRHLGIGVGFTLAEGTANIDRQLERKADLFVAQTANGLIRINDESAAGRPAVNDVPATTTIDLDTAAATFIPGTLRLDLTITNLAAGSTVTYAVLFNSGSGFSTLANRSFVLSDSHQLYFGIDERSGTSVLSDNFSIVASSYTPPAVNDIVWRATADNVWNTTSVNWVDAGLGISPYAFFGGANVTFNDTAANTAVNVAGPVLPGSMLVNNVNSNYTFSGAGSIGGSGALTKLGAGNLTINTVNAFTGGSLISGGAVVMGNNAALGTGTINLGGGRLVSGGSDRTIANPVTVSGTSEISVEAGNFTLTAPVTSAVGNFDLHVRGGGTLTIQDSLSNPGAGGLDIHASRVVLDGCVATNADDGIRLYTEGTTAELVITNNASYVLGRVSGAPNVRLGQVAVEPGTAILRISSGSLEMGPLAQGILVGAAAGTSGMLYQTGGTIRWSDNNNASAGVKVGNASATSGEYHMDGGLLVTPTITGAIDALGTFYANGGTIKVATNTLLSTFIANVSFVLEAAGAVIDNSGFDAVVTSPVSGSGPLRVTGAGSLSLAGQNSFTGETIVSNGTLNVTLPASGSSVVLANGAGLTSTVGTAGGSWTSTSISMAGNNTLTFANVPGGIVPAALLTTTTLQASGVTTVGVTGTGWPAGTTTLLNYGTLTGGGTIAFAPLPGGLEGYLTNNTAEGAIQLVVGYMPSTLTWHGFSGLGTFGGLWDIGTTLNWNSGVAAYGQSVLVGDHVIFDYAYSPNLNVQIAANVLPASVSVTNDLGSDFVFHGPGKIGGSGGLTKALGGNLTILSTNDYAGGTGLFGGRTRAGNNAALGSGPIVIGGGGISSTDGTARTFTNALTITQGGATLGDATDSGLLTFTSPIDFNGAARNLTVNSPAVFVAGTGGDANERIGAKNGPASLTLKGQNTWNGTSDIRNGTLVLDGGSITNTERVIPDAEGFDSVARLVITNGATIVTTGTANNLRVARAAVSPGTNIIDLAGIYRTPNAIAPNGRILLQNTVSLYSELNVLSGGDAAGRAVTSEGTGLYPTRINLDGGIIRATESNPVWFSGITETFVRSGDANFDDGGFVVGVAQDLLDGGGNGGLTKTGSGTLLLNGTNTYTGATVVSAGALGGTGIISGPVTVLTGAALAPGASIGTLTISNHLTLNAGSSVVAEVNKNTLEKDLVQGLANVNYAGTLVVTNVGGTAFAGGETFQLFSASGAKSGNFTTVTVLPPTGATGAFNPASGVVTIQAPTTPPPTNISFKVSGGKLVLDWPAGQGWKLQSQTNALGVGLSSNWVEIIGATPPLTNTLHGTPGTVFYRLAY